MKRRLAAGFCIIAILLSTVFSVSVSAEDKEKVKLPDRYDLRELGYVSSIKHQFGPTCVLYASTAVLESSAMVSGFGEYDLAEYQIGYLATHLLHQEGSPIDGEGYEYGGKIWYKDGGMEVDSIFSALMRGYAIETEDKYPVWEYYEEGTDFPDVDITYDGALYLDSYYYAPASDQELIKELVYKYGAAHIPMYVTGWFFNEDFYNPETKAAYVTTDTYAIDHVVAIIGWDDNFSKYNFGTIPLGDGAWIIKNSWGESWDGDIEKNYTYVSYYDQCFKDRGLVVTAKTKNERTYDRIYQYDGGIGPYVIKGIKDVVINFNAEENETITGVRIKPMGAGDPNNVRFTPTNAKVNVYKGTFDKDNISNVKPIYTKKYSVEYAGYQTIEFDEEVKLYAGKDYYIKVTFDDPVGYALDGQQGNNIADANPGETFVKVEKEDEFFDTVKTYNAYPRSNACIKVLVKDKTLSWQEKAWECIGFRGGIFISIGILLLIALTFLLMRKRRGKSTNESIEF